MPPSDPSSVPNALVVRAAAPETLKTVKTVCPYCGVGCGLEVVPFGEALKVRGDRSHPSSQGMVCVKGATILESIDHDRLLYPQYRDRLDDDFRRISWDEAFDRIVARIQTVLATQGPDGLCMYGSGQFVTEDYYTAQKLWKGCLGTNHFDANSRLCMSSAVVGYQQSFGSDGPPCTYEDLELTDCLLAIGTNTAECHPIVFNRFRKHHKANRGRVKLIVVDPRRTPTADVADLHLAIRPGTDIDLLHGLARLLLDWDQIDRTYIADHTTGFAAYADLLRDYPSDRVAAHCGVSQADLETAARWWAESERVLSLWSMGINQSSEGTAKVRSIINLHLLTGQIGRPGAGPFSLTGQPNAMGGREAGGLSGLLPGYRSVKNPHDRAEVESFWGLPAGQIAPEPGRTTWQIIEGLEADRVGLLWIAATNPAVSYPDLNRAKAAWRRSPFTIYQEAYDPTETSGFAHLLLPATQWSEKTGTMTNSERMVTLSQGFQTPPGESREDWAIFAEVGRRLGFAAQFPFQTSAEVYAEFVQLTNGQPCDVSGLSHDRLRRDGPQQWPCPIAIATPAQEHHQDHPPETSTQPSTQAPAKRLYTSGQFHTPDGRARFLVAASHGLAEPVDSEYPFVLTIGRLYGHWHTQTRTGRTAKIVQMHPHPFVEIHPQDADPLGIAEGDRVAILSRRGRAEFPAKVTIGIRPGTVFVPMHWGALWAKDTEANALTHPAACPDSQEPELKACAVRLVRLGTAPT